MSASWTDPRRRNRASYKDLKQKLTVQLLSLGTRSNQGGSTAFQETAHLIVAYQQFLLGKHVSSSMASISFLLQSQAQTGKTSSLGGKHLLQASLLSSSSSYKNNITTKTSQFLLSCHLRCRSALHNLKCQTTPGVQGSSSRAFLILPSSTHRKSTSPELATSCHLLHIRTKPDSPFSDHQPLSSRPVIRLSQLFTVLV